MTTLRLGTRGSQLALVQARLVAQRIAESSGPRSEVIIIKTSGDQLGAAPLSAAGGKRLFVKELEDALLGGEVDIAVHSSKDMPVELPKGLSIGAVLPREDPADALVLPAHGRDRGSLSAPSTKTAADRAAATLPESIGRDARIGTGSVRRVAQLRRLFPGASYQNVRGNLDTRLRKLDAGDHDLLVLAAAGLRRLGLDSRISMTLSLDDCIPAPGQGIIAIESRDGDTAVQAALAAVNDADAAAALDAERALIVALGGGCQMPIGGLATSAGAAALELSAIVASLDGTRVLRYKKVGTKAEAKALGREVAAYLLNAGASKILDESRTPNPEPRQLT